MSGDARLISWQGRCWPPGCSPRWSPPACACRRCSRITVAERTLLGWAGLRGGVPVVLATLPVIDHVSSSLEFFDLVFFAVLVSTLLQGATVEPLARALGLSERPDA